MIDTNYYKVKGFSVHRFEQKIYELKYMDYILIAVLSETECDDMDAVVVMAIAEYDEIYEVLRTKISDAILSITELINEI